MELKGPRDAPVRVGDRTVSALLMTAASLSRGDVVEGPALLESYSSTIWVPPDWSASRDDSGNLMLKKVSA